MPNIPLTAGMADRLEVLRTHPLGEKSQKIIRASHKAERQAAYQQALLALFQSFEEALVDAVSLRFDLHAGQRKKLYFKRDRTKILRQHGIDYPAIDGYETAQTLALIAQSIQHEAGVVTTELHDIFPFWKEGFAMVQLDNAYDILSEDIQLHFEQLLDALLDD